MASLSYTPKPHEQAYYDALFAVADVQRSGAIGGADAVRFFSTSKLPVSDLKTVWTVSDQNPPTNSLDKRKFYVAVRLIQLLQNGTKGQGPNLEAPENVVLRPVHFEGVSGVSVPLPPPEQPSRAQTPASSTPPRHPPPGGPPQQLQPNAAQLPPQQAPPAGANTTTLAAQDPYTMNPNEQARYESLFPQYAKPDGFVYGPEAVALFGKSGMPQPQLAVIWNLADSPVDNRLDKLEFCIAMHLIVCVSKKQLPMPSALPSSLVNLKTQQTQPTQPQPPAPAAPQSPGPGAMAAGGGMSTTSSIPSPTPPSMAMPNAGMPAPVAQRPEGGMQSLPGPPPLQPAGGTMDISDAFAGLSPADSGAAYTANAPSLQQQQPPPVQPTTSFDASAAAGGASMTSASPVPVATVETTTAKEEEAAAPPKSTAQLKESYAMGDSNDELVKLKNVLQKLQAENISLKASMSNLTEEEKDVQKELIATVAEIGKLSNELTSLRAKVLASKSRLLQATAELKAAQEKKGVIKDLITEAQATKDAMDDAYNGIEQANEAARAAPPAPPPAPTADLFGFDAPAPAQAPAPAPADMSASYQQQQQYQQQQHDQHIHRTHSESPGIQQSYSSQEGGLYGGISSSGPGYEEGEGIMGGAPTPLPSEPTMPPATSYPPVMSASMGGAAPAAAASMDNIEALKKKLKEAEDVARDAAESKRQMEAHAKELRRLADEADHKSRQYNKLPDEVKKKGFLGRGKKQEKKDPKEAENLARDAHHKKDELMTLQSQLNDAQAMVTDTQKEVERLRREVEEAEIAAASAASMHDQQPPPPPSQPAPPAPMPTGNGGYGGYGGSMGGAPPPPQPSYGMPPPVPEKGPENNGSFGGADMYGGAMGSMGSQPMAASFSSSVMSGGGMSIPTPSAGGGGAEAPPATVGGMADDPYSNPFE